MPRREQPRVVTIDEGAGPVKVIKDPAGRVITKQQITKIRDKQEADLEKVTDLRDKLQASDRAAIREVAGQVKDRAAKRLSLLARQQRDLESQRAKLEAGDTGATQEVVDQMIRRLSRRIEQFTAARDRSDELLAELE